MLETYTALIHLGTKEPGANQILGRELSLLTPNGILTLITALGLGAHYRDILLRLKALQ